MTTLGEIRDRLAREGLVSSSAELGPAVADRAVRNVASDSRQVSRGTLFCAIRGSAGDGHDYLPQVARAGAAAALVEAAAPGVEIPQIRVEDGRRAAAFAAAEFFRDPWRDLLLLGVTGTNGKTTTVTMLRHLLATELPAASIGTLGAVGPDGRLVPGTEGLTTPGPVELARWIRRLRDGGARAVAMEVSSHALHQNRAAAARFDAALFTNLSRDHLDYHQTVEAYRAAKLRLLDLVDPDGVAVLNADEPAWRDVQPPVRTVRYAVRADADVRAVDVRPDIEGVEWTLRTPAGEERVHVPVYGLYNVANALGAAAVLWALGWPVDTIAARLADLPQVPGRLERVPRPPNAPAVVIDYAHTPDALARALEALRPLTEGRLIVVFGAGGDRDRGKRPEMGRVAAEGADLAIVTSDNPRHEDPARIADEIESGMGAAPRRRVLDRREAIREAVETASSDDLVLLAGKGHETYQIWGDEKRPFDERDVLAELFAGRGVQR